MINDATFRPNKAFTIWIKRFILMLVRVNGIKTRFKNYKKYKSILIKILKKSFNSIFIILFSCHKAFDFFKS